MIPQHSNADATLQREDLRMHFSKLTQLEDMIRDLKEERSRRKDLNRPSSREAFDSSRFHQRRRSAAAVEETQEQPTEDHIISRFDECAKSVRDVLLSARRCISVAERAQKKERELKAAWGDLEKRVKEKETLIENERRRESEVLRARQRFQDERLEIEESKRQLKEEWNKLESYLNSIRSREERLQMQQERQDREASERKREREQLLAKEEELQRMQVNVREEARRVTSLEEALREREKKIHADMATTVSTAETRIKDGLAYIEDREKALQDRVRALERSAEEIELLNQGLKEKEARLDAVEEEMRREKDNWVQESAQREKALHGEVEEELKRLKEIRDKEERNIRATKDELCSKSRELEQREERLHQLESQLLSKDSILQLRSKELDEREACLQQAETRFLERVGESETGLRHKVSALEKEEERVISELKSLSIARQRVEERELLLESRLRDDTKSKGGARVLPARVDDNQPSTTGSNREVIFYFSATV